ncbi:MAG: hypothetical protein U0359_32590 [Byssovorax sp.]
MSEQAGGPGEVAYDPADLRRQIAASFSAPELRKLAETLGVAGSIRWTHGTQEAARDLVREFERYYGLSILVAKVRELRPLVDWPDPSSLPPPASQARAAPVEPADAAVPAPPADPGSARAPLPEEPLAPPAALASSEPSPPASSSSAPSAQAASRPAPVWPGTVASLPDPPRGQGIDPKILILVAGLTVLAAVIAYAAGRASSPTAAPAPTESATTVAAAPVPRRAPCPATRAADAVARSLANVAKLCELAPGTEVNADLLARAFERCGPPPPRAAMTFSPPPSPVLPPDLPRDPALDPEPARPHTPRQSAPAPAPDKGPGAACIAQCNAENRSCNAGCGAEPSQSTQYDGYMKCRSRCRSAMSHCLLACPQ